MKRVNRLFYLGIPILVLLGMISHFVYDLFNIEILGILFPVNESVYEHTKLVLFPLIVFYSYLYIKEKPELSRILLTFLTSLATSIFLIASLFYSYTGAFGIEYVVVDILIFVVAIILSQLLALHIYNRADATIDYKTLLVLILTYFLINIIFTYDPPKLPLFIEI